MSASSQQYVVARQVQFVAVDELAPSERQELGAEEGGVIIERPGGRTPSKLVNAATAQLIERFEVPATLAKACADLATSVGAEPGDLVDAAASVLEDLVASKVIVPCEHAAQALPLLRTGDQVGRFTLEELIRRTDDVEVWRGRSARAESDVAIKVAASMADDAQELIRGEIETLKSLRYGSLPRLIEADPAAGRPFLVIPWFAGSPVAQRADHIRRSQNKVEDRLLVLAIALSEEVAAIHDGGAIHGDLKSSNTIVDGAGRVQLIDFAMTSSTDRQPSGRTWDYACLEPEAARAVLAGGRPGVTMKSEQFALGVLLYRIVTGLAYRAPHLDQRTALEQIRDESPTGFAARGIEPWPAMEAVLSRALQPDPAARFDTVAALVEALRTIRPSGRPSGKRLQGSVATSPASTLIEQLCDVELTAKVWFPESAHASLHRGSAGFAWFLYRAAQIRNRPDLLALADVWADRSLAGSAEVDRLVAPQFQVSAARAEHSSPLHDAAGPLTVSLLVAAARNDLDRVAELVGALAPLVETQSPLQEVFFGNAGHLTAAATALDAVRPLNSVHTATLEASLSVQLDRLVTYVEASPGVTKDARLPHFGMAHGWAGILHAIVTASRELGREPPPGVARRIDELADLAVVTGRSVSWSGGCDGSMPSHAPGWCSGTAGHVLLWLAAWRLYRDERFLRLAEQAGVRAWEHPDRTTNLCCGLAGRALALLQLFSRTGDDNWLDRATKLLSFVPELISADTPSNAKWSLFRGNLGIALAHLESERPSLGVFPLFEPQGWSGT